jgi:DNA-binding transcriptional MerR regulator
MSAGEIASRARITANPERYYPRIRLPNSIQSAHNGYHNYSQKSLKRMTFIRKAKQLVFSVYAIRRILVLADDEKNLCPLARQWLEDKAGRSQVISRTKPRHVRCHAPALAQWRHIPDKLPDQHNTWEQDQWMTAQQEQADEAQDTRTRTEPSSPGSHRQSAL